LFEFNTNKIPRHVRYALLKIFHQTTIKGVKMLLCNFQPKKTRHLLFQRVQLGGGLRRVGGRRGGAPTRVQPHGQALNVARGAEQKVVGAQVARVLLVKQRLVAPSLIAARHRGELAARVGFFTPQLYRSG